MAGRTYSQKQIVGEEGGKGPEQVLLSFSSHRMPAIPSPQIMKTLKLLVTPDIPSKLPDKAKHCRVLVFVFRVLYISFLFADSS